MPGMIDVVIRHVQAFVESRKHPQSGMGASRSGAVFEAVDVSSSRGTWAGSTPLEECNSTKSSSISASSDVCVGRGCVTIRRSRLVGDTDAVAGLVEFKKNRGLNAPAVAGMALPCQSPAAELAVGWR
jgi:hypothetical protein